MGLSSAKDLFFEYSTFGGETNFTKSVGSAIFGLITTVVGLQLSLISAGISGFGVSTISIISIILFPIGIIYYTFRSARRTTDSKFHTRRGRTNVIATYLFIGGSSVLLLHTVGITIMTQVGFLDLTLPDILLGLALSLGFAFVVSVANYSTLSDRYPPLSKVLNELSSESSEKLERIENEIEGIGHVPRSETNRILEAIQNPDDLDNIILKGEGGVGKSGILKRVSENSEHDLLFIDASSYSIIRSESDLAEELGLDISLERCIRQIAANRPFVVIIDQLDDTNRETGEIYKNLILTVAQVDQVSTIFACRTYDLKHYSEFVKLSNSEHFDNIITVNTLEESKVRDHLEELGVTSPSRDLVDLCKEIEYLDVVGRLANRGSDLENVSEQVAVWEEYGKLLEEDHSSDDQLRGTRIIDRAVEHAVRATESGSSVFSISDRQWTDRKLRSMGVIQRGSKSPGERMFRFRHHQFQLYLYARDKVSRAADDEDLFRDTLDELDENINNDVVKWMFAVYTDQEEELPDDTDEFLKEILDNIEGFGFYWASKILDVVKKWDASQNQSVTNTVLNRLEKREDLYTYFFDEGTDPSWAEALAETGRFQDPSGHLLGYLHEIASLHPEIVSDIIREDIAGLDRRSQATLVSVIKELPLEYGIDLTDIVQEGLDDQEPIIDLFYSRASEFTEDIINGEFFDKGLELSDSLLTVRLKGKPEGPNDEMMGSYYLTSIFEDGTLERLIRNRSEETLGLFEGHMRKAAEHRAENRGREVEDLSFFHLKTVSNYGIGKDDRYQPFELYIGFLREALDNWFEIAAEDVQKQKIESYLDEYPIFRAFGFYLLREYGGNHRDLVAKELLRKENYSDSWLKKEFNLLLKHGFRHLSKDQQDQVVELINSVPVQDTFDQIAEDRQEEQEDMTVDEIAEQYASRWIRDKLWPIKEHLPEDEKKELSELVDQFEDDPEDPGNPAIRGGAVSYESPESEEDLRDRSPEDLINFSIEEPFEEEEWYENNSVEEIGRRGAAEKVAGIILDDPEKYASELPRLTEAPESYSTQLLGHLEDRIEEEPEILDNETFRNALWDLSEQIISNTDDWPSRTRKRVGWLLRDGFGNEDSYGYFLIEESRVRNLIFILIEDPDPDIERDRPPEDYAGHNDPSHNALNTVRPVALDSLIIYAKRKVDESGELDSEIKSKLANKLDDISLGVHSVFGRRFVTLWIADRDWVIEHLPDIFPRSQSRQDKEKFTAAWDSYVAFNNPYKDIFPELRSYYFHAIDLMVAGENTETVNAEQRMASHLLANYLFEYDLENWTDSLLAYLYDRSDRDFARQVASSLWKWGDNADESEALDKWEKTSLLWERRLDQVGEDETFSEEISWFVRWLEHVENSVELDEVEDLIRNSLNHIAQNKLAWMSLEEYLSTQSINHTETAVDIFYTLNKGYERPVHHSFTEEAKAILRPGLEEFDNTDETYDKAFEAAQTYDAEAQSFLDDHR